MCQKCSKSTLLWAWCSKSPFVLAGTTVELCERLAHHGELGLAIPLKHVGVALPEHLGNKMIRNSASTKACGKGMTQLVQREVGDAGALEGGSPDLLEAADVRLLAACAEPRKEVFTTWRLLYLGLEHLVRQVSHRHVTDSVRRLRVWDVNQQVLQ